MEVFFYCSMSGDKFNPGPFPERGLFDVSDYQFVGDLEKRGRRKGQVATSGYINFSSKDEDFDTFVGKLYSAKNLFLRSEADRRVVHIFLGYHTQCNWEFSPDALRMISELDLTLTLSCDRVDDDT